VLLAASLGRGSQGEKAKTLLRSFSTKGEVMTSALAIDEFVWTLTGITRKRNEAVEQAILLFHLSGLTITPVTRPASYHSLLYMKKYPHLRPRDALHIATALASGADCIVSNDKDFDGIKEIKREALA